MPSSQTLAPPLAGWRPKHPPRVEGAPLVGSTLAFQSDQIAFLRDNHRDYGDVFRASIAGQQWYFVRDPAIVHTINVQRSELFAKPELAKKFLREFYGNGLVPNDGPHWKRQHDMIIGAFHRHRIESYVPVMRKALRDQVSHWVPGEERDLHRESLRLGMTIATSTLFGEPLSEGMDEVLDSLSDVSEMLVRHVNLPLPVPRWWPSPGNRKKWRAIRNVEAVIARLVTERRREGVDRGDLLSHMVFAHDADGRAMSDTEIRDESVNMFFASQETTATAIAWCWAFLARHPAVWARLRDELDAHRDRGDDHRALERLEYLDAVVRETLRMRPPVWSYMRTAVCDLEVGGYFFEAGAPILISPLALGLCAALHPNPDEFRPERWTREYRRALPKGAAVHFAAGPRVCIGQGFALMEMKVLLAELLARFEPTMRVGFEPALVPEMTLHPGKDGIPFTVTTRAGELAPC